MLVDHLLRPNNEYKNLKKTRDSKCFYQNKVNKACFYHDMASENFKDLSKRTALDKVLCDKDFDIAKNLKYGVCQCRLSLVVDKVFKRWSSGGATKNKIMSN